MRQSFAHFRIALYAPVLAGMLLASGCASLPPPTAELDAARQAVLRAESADADQYAISIAEQPGAPRFGFEVARLRVT